MTESPNRPRRLLVSVASKHGATAEIGDQLGETLRKSGFDVTVAAPSDVDTAEGFYAIILGSSVYAGHWQEEAKTLASRIAELESLPPVWIFSSGPVGDPPKPEEEPVDVASIVEMIAPREHRIFAGKIDKSKLGFGERALVAALRVPEGDFRDWNEITTWAKDIAEQLHKELETHKEPQGPSRR
jgi:menaquinone-dependent protoporphyrinogen oxidase